MSNLVKILISLSGRASFNVSTIICIWMIGNMLDSQAVSSFLLCMSIVYFSSTICGLGLQQISIKEIAPLSFDERQGMINIIISNAVIGSLGSLVVVAAFWILILEKYGIGFLGLVFMCIWGFAFTMQGILSEIRRGVDDALGASLVNGLIYGFTTITIIMLFNLSDLNLNLTNLLFIYSIASSASVLYYIFRFNWSFSDLTAFNKNILKDSVPLLAVSVSAFVITQSDGWIIAFFFSKDEASDYIVAAKLISFISGFISLIPLTLSSSIRRSFYESNADKIQKTIYFGNILSISSAILLFIPLLLYSDSILNAFFGNASLASASVLRILSVGHLIIICTNMVGTLMIMANEQDALARIMIFGAAFQTVFLSILASTGIGINVYAACVIFTWILIQFSLSLFISRKMGIGMIFNKGKYDKIKG